MYPRQREPKVHYDKASERDGATRSNLPASAVIGDRRRNGEVQHLALRREAEASVLAQAPGTFLQGGGGLALRHEPLRGKKWHKRVVLSLFDFHD